MGRAIPGAVARKHFRRIGEVELIALPDQTSVAAAITELEKDPNVVYAEPNYVWAANDVVPNDPSFAQLWGLSNTGQTGGTSGIDVGAKSAWQAGVGASQVVIGVIDTGIDYTHPDLAGNIWLNDGEIAANGIDDDANGFVDDMHGIDTYYDDADPFDDRYHGTHVAGTIGAVGDNGIGVTGVAWQVRLAACKFLGPDGFGATSDALDCLEYFLALKQRGVNLVATNNSWGGGFASQALSDGIAAHAAAGVLFVAAAGNDASNTDVVPHYPSSYAHASIISVAAIDHHGNRASFSNYGASSVDLAAPGVSIYSTMPAGAYTWLNGTSMAAPHVAGVVALIAAQDPLLSSTAIKAKILADTAPLASMQGACVTGGMLRASLVPAADGDGDGMPDAFEAQHDLDPFDPADAVADPDADMWTNLTEYRRGTDPNDPDTDDDGLVDGAEEQHDAYPLIADSDADGVLDGDEVALGIDPRDPDSDDDYLSDAGELGAATDPLQADSDDDGFVDGDEVTVGVDPLDDTKVPTALAIQNGSFETGDFSEWTLETGAGAGAAPAVVAFDTAGTGQAHLAARFQTGCDDLYNPLGCPAPGEAQDALTQAFYTEGGAVVVEAMLAWHYPLASVDGGRVEVYLDGQRVGDIHPGYGASGAVVRKRLRVATVLEEGGHELRLRVFRRYEAAANSPYQYLDDVRVLSAVGGPTLCQTLTVLQDDFETSLSQWTIAGNVTVNQSAEYSGLKGADINRTASMTATLNTVGASNVRLAYRMRVNGYDAGEDIDVEWCASSCELPASWNAIQSVGGTSTYLAYEHYLPAAAEGQAALKLRFSANATGTGEWAYVDDLIVDHVQCLSPIAPRIDTTTWAASGQTVAISGTASDPNGDLASVEVQVLSQGAVVATGVAFGNGAYQFTTTLLPGSYTARATAVDALGLRRVGAPISFSVSEGDLFADTFERTNLGAGGFWWYQNAYTDGSAKKSGVYGARLHGGSGEAKMEIVISTADHVDVVLGYARRTINADTGENLVVQISTDDGQSWQTLDTAFGPDYASVTFPLPSGHPRLHIRYVFVANGSTEGAFVDNLFVVGVRAVNLAFVTSQSWPASGLGGLAGADAKCNAAAVAAGLDGTYVAWLSDSQNHAKDRIGDASGWARLDGYPLARTVGDLLSGRIIAPVRLDEYGQTVDSASYYTATEINGMRATTYTTCSDWAVSSSSQVWKGSTAGTTQSWTSGAIGICSNPGRLLCLGVDHDTVADAPAGSGRLAFLGSAMMTVTGGLAAADARCQSDASAASLPGTFLALLATSTSSAASRFNLSGATWVRPDGMPILVTAAALASAPPLLAPINVEADGDYIGNFSTLGGAATMGTVGLATQTCSDWTNTSGQARQGTASLADSNAFGNAIGACAGRRIYCLQQ